MVTDVSLMTTIEESIKRHLKRAPVLRALAARASAARLQRELRSLRRRFQTLANVGGITYSESHALESARARLARRGIHFDSVKTADRGIFWAGTNEQQDRSGFLQSLQTFGRVTFLSDEDGRYGFRSFSAR